jgi:hypothetical protein
VLDANTKEADRCLEAHLVEVSPSGARLRITEPVHVGAAVRLDVGDHAILGEVCHCSRVANGYLCGIEIDQVLSYLADLNRLMEALSGVPRETATADPLVIRMRR